MLDFLLLRGLEYKLRQKQPPFSTQMESLPFRCASTSQVLLACVTKPCYERTKVDREMDAKDAHTVLLERIINNLVMEHFYI
ncbi:hypothetical protein HanIR_Chr10g0495561 [Helianthus annuus]|nr:hypothetical protein HanIR_Chr10g0495561 [Helianthus annuus]